MIKGFHIEAYKFYKKEYAGIILFHVGVNYEAYLDDALSVWKVRHPNVNPKSDITICRFSENKLMDVLQKLQEQGLPVHIVEYRNSDGEFDVPKVKQIIEDMEADY